MDNFFANMFRREAQGLGKGAGGGEPTASQGTGGSFAENNKVHIGTRGDAGLSVAAYYRALTLRSNTMSQLIMQYQRFSTNGKNFYEDTRGKGGRINWLCQYKPNPRMNWPVLVRTAEAQRVKEGNAYIYIEREAGEIVAFWLCSGASYDYTTDKYTVSYDFDKHKTVGSNDVIHLKNEYSSDNGITGQPTLKYMHDTLVLAATNDKLVTENAAKGGKMKLLVQEDKQTGFGLGRANKKELEKITKQLQDDVYANDVVLLNNVANVTPISQSLQQQEVQMARQFSVREIARYMGVPAILLMDDSNSSYKSPEAATLEFLSRTIAPLIREWEAEFNTKVLEFEDYGIHRFHFCEKPLFRLDLTAQGKWNKDRLESGVATVNELRAEQDLPAVKGGDQNLVSTNLQPLDDIKVRGGATELGPGNYTVKHPKGKEKEDGKEEGGDA